MDFKKIELLISSQNGGYRRLAAEEQIVVECLEQLEVDRESDFSQFYLKYNASGILSNKGFELLDICNPTRQIFDSTNYAHSELGLSTDFICLTDVEGDGFVIYNKETHSVYDIGIDKVEFAIEQKISPQWNNFSDFLYWYLL